MGSTLRRTLLFLLLLAVLQKSAMSTKCPSGARCLKCAFSIGILPSTHIYIGIVIIFLFIIGQTVHYFYLEERHAQMFEELDEPEGERSRILAPEESVNEEEERDRRERLVYGLPVGLPYEVESSKTPGGRIITVMEKRPKRFAAAPPITPASIISKPKTTQKEELRESIHVDVLADKWGRGHELASLVNEVEVPSSKTTVEEKSRFAMELVQQHMEKMTEQKVFVHGLLEEKNQTGVVEEKHRLLCGSDNIETEVIGEVRLELKLQMTSPEHLLMIVFTAKVEPTMIEQPKTVVRVSELSAIPMKEVPKDKPPTPPKSNRKPKAEGSDEMKQQPPSSRPKGKSSRQDKRRKDSSRKKAPRKSEVSEKPRDGPPERSSTTKAVTSKEPASTQEKTSQQKKRKAISTIELKPSP